MTLSVQKALEKRAAINFFDPSKKIDDKQIHELVRLATLAPTAFNLQNWHFIAVQSEEAKKKLYAAAYGQQKVLDAAVTFIITGAIESHKNFDRVVKTLVANGVSETDAAVWKGKVSDLHENNPSLQKDEAFRSASLAAMALMLAAEEQGLVSGPMSGFDGAAVSAAFDLDENTIPVMLVAVGYEAEGNYPQNPRLATSEVLDIV